MIIYKIKLPIKQDADAFATFMREEYFPAVHKGPTRIGQVINLVLLQGGDGHSAHDFYLHLDWDGLAQDHANLIRIDDDNINQKFTSFGAHIEYAGTYTEVATLSRNLQ